MRALIALAVILTGCSTTGEIEYYRARAAMQRDPAPLVRLTAQPGEAITGLQSLEVYAPDETPPLAQYQHPGWRVAETVLGAAIPLAIGQLGQWATAKTLSDAGTDTARIVSDTARDVVVVDQPDPVIVEQPPTPDPVIVTQPDPIIVQPAEPIIVTQPEPIIVQPGA